MSVMGFQKKVWIGVGGWDELNQFFFGFLELFKLCKAHNIFYEHEQTAMGYFQ